MALCASGRVDVQPEPRKLRRWPRGGTTWEGCGRLGSSSQGAFRAPGVASSPNTQLRPRNACFRVKTHWPLPARGAPRPTHGSSSGQKVDSVVDGVPSVWALAAPEGSSLVQLVTRVHGTQQVLSTHHPAPSLSQPPTWMHISSGEALSEPLHLSCSPPHCLAPSPRPLSPRSQLPLVLGPCVAPDRPGAAPPSGPPSLQLPRAHCLLVLTSSDLGPGD